MILIECNQHFYELKFGTNCLIYLNEFLHISDIEEKEKQLEIEQDGDKKKQLGKELSNIIIALAKIK